MNDQALAQLLLAGEPKLVVLVGEPVLRLTQALSDIAQSNAVSPIQVVESLNIEEYLLKRQTIAHETSDCVMCLDLPDDADQPEKLLGLASRVAPRLLLVEHSQRTPGAVLLGDEQFFAFGFRSVDKSVEVSGMQRHTYAFSLSDYKQSPDWLNARFWAHPERFNLKD